MKENYVRLDQKDRLVEFDKRLAFHAFKNSIFSKSFKTKTTVRKTV